MDQKAAPGNVTLTKVVMKTFGAGRVFKHNTEVINSMDFRQDGEMLITSSTDESIRLYDVNQGIFKKKILVKRYGNNIYFFLSLYLSLSIFIFRVFPSACRFTCI